MYKYKNKVLSLSLIRIISWVSNLVPRAFPFFVMMRHDKEEKSPGNEVDGFLIAKGNPTPSPALLLGVPSQETPYCAILSSQGSLLSFVQHLLYTWNFKQCVLLWPLYIIRWLRTGRAIGRGVPSIKPQHPVRGAPFSWTASAKASGSSHTRSRLSKRWWNLS